MGLVSGIYSEAPFVFQVLVMLWNLLILVIELNRRLMENRKKDGRGFLKILEKA